MVIGLMLHELNAVRQVAQLIYCAHRVRLAVSGAYSTSELSKLHPPKRPLYRPTRMASR